VLKTILTVAGIGCLLVLPAHAYVDPGTGSMAIQVLIGGVVAAAFMIKTYYYELKRRIARLFGRATDNSMATEAETGATSVSEEPPKQ
jgi:hypothetical protein